MGRSRGLRGLGRLSGWAGVRGLWSGASEDRESSGQDGVAALPGDERRKGRGTEPEGRGMKGALLWWEGRDLRGRIEGEDS